MVLGFPTSPLGWTPGRRASPLPVIAAVCALCALASVAQAGDHRPVAHAEGRDPTYAIKAGYLYKLTAFVGWPAAAFEGPASPFRLCVAGRDPFGGMVDHAVRGARVGEHPVVVVRMPAVAKSTPCHMLFLAAARTQTPREMLAMIAGQPLLTVADEGLDAPGAMVQFVTVDSRIRFAIRADAAQAAGLTVSSKLLALAAQPRETGR